MRSIPKPAIYRTSDTFRTTRDKKYCAAFRAILESGSVRCVALPARSPNLNAFAERRVESANQQCLRKLILFGEGSLRRALTEDIAHFHSERNHQGKGNLLLFPDTKALRAHFTKSEDFRVSAGCSTITHELHE
jgi:hypothetical protein